MLPDIARQEPAGQEPAVGVADLGWRDGLNSDTGVRIFPNLNHMIQIQRRNPYTAPSQGSIVPMSETCLLCRGAARITMPSSLRNLAPFLRDAIYALYRECKIAHPEASLP